MKRTPNRQIVLKPQDLMVLLKLATLGNNRQMTYADLGAALDMSASEVHASIARARSARLVNLEDGRPVVVREALRNFLLHGARYAYPATLGSITRGVPTSYAGPPLASQLSQPHNDPPPVWPDPSGEVRGVAFHPLYPTVPAAARKDPSLYELLVLFDALRGGAARERELASQHLSERLA